MGKAYNARKRGSCQARREQRRKKTKAVICLKRILCFILSILLLAGLAGCMNEPFPAERQSDLPIVTTSHADTSASIQATESAETVTGASTEAPTEAPTEAQQTLSEDGVYDSKEEVALYIHLYGHLPSNYITKREAEELGWHGGKLEPYAPGKCIGGSRFGNYEGLLPDANGRKWTECDIDTLGAKSRGAKRIVFSNDGLIYYTEDHYESFELLYGKED